ncbi:MAG: hypothetical protein NT033_07615 [Candidatus Omnitrophica bacterium]|nr:hypothetical protein [Candidatus Omnitrophota bacterium]
MHDLQIGRGLRRVSSTKFNAVAREVSDANRLSEAFGLMGKSLTWGWLIYCKSSSKREEFKKFLKERMNFKNDTAEGMIVIVDGKEKEIKFVERVPEGSVEDLARIGHESEIILGGKQTATGADNQGRRHLIVLDGENWSYSELLQVISRNNREGGSRDERFVLFDPDRLIQKQKSFDDESARGKSISDILKAEKIIGDPAGKDTMSSDLEAAGLWSKNQPKEQQAIFSRQQSDRLEDLLLNAHYHDIIQNSNALLHHSRQAGWSIIIETLNKMLRNANPRNAQEIKLLNDKLAEAIEHKNNPDLMLSRYSLEGEKVLNQMFKDVASFAERIFETLSTSSEVSNLNKVIAGDFLYAAKVVRSDYDSIKADKNASFRTAEDLIGVVAAAKRFEGRVLPEEIKVPGDVSGDSKVVQLVSGMDKSKTEKGEAALTIEQKAEFYKTIHTARLNPLATVEVLKMTAGFMSSQIETGPPLILANLVCDLNSELAKIPDTLSPLEHHQQILQATLAFINNNISNVTGYTSNQQKEFADTLAFLVRPQYEYNFDTLEREVSSAFFYNKLLGALKTSEKYQGDPVRQRLVYLDLVRNPGYLAVWLQTSRRGSLSGWRQRRQMYKEMGVMPEAMRFVLNHPLPSTWRDALPFSQHFGEGFAELHAANKFLKLLSKGFGNASDKSKAKFDNGLTRTAKFLGISAETLQEFGPSLSNTLGYLSFLTNPKNKQIIKSANEIIELELKDNKGKDYDIDARFRELTGLPHAFEWQRIRSWASGFSIVDKKARLEEVGAMLKQVEANPEAEFEFIRQRLLFARPGWIAENSRLAYIVAGLLSFKAASTLGITGAIAAAGVSGFGAFLLGGLVAGLPILAIKGIEAYGKKHAESWVNMRLGVFIPGTFRIFSGWPKTFGLAKYEEQKKFLSMHPLIKKEEKKEEPEQEQYPWMRQEKKKEEEKRLTFVSLEGVSAKDGDNKLLQGLLRFASPGRTAPDVEAVRLKAKQIEVAIQQLPEEEQKKLKHYESVFFLLNPDNGKNIADLLEKADVALKDNTKNTVNVVTVSAIPRSKPQADQVVILGKRAYTVEYDKDNKNIVKLKAISYDEERSINLDKDTEITLQAGKFGIVKNETDGAIEFVFGNTPADKHRAYKEALEFLSSDAQRGEVETLWKHVAGKETEKRGFDGISKVLRPLYGDNFEQAFQRVLFRLNKKDAEKLLKELRETESRYGLNGGVSSGGPSALEGPKGASIGAASNLEFGNNHLEEAQRLLHLDHAAAILEAKQAIEYYQSPIAPGQEGYAKYNISIAKALIEQAKQLLASLLTDFPEAQSNELLNDFYFTVDKILSDTTTTVEQKIDKIKGLRNMTKRDLTVHLEGKTELKKTLRQVEDVSGGFDKKGIIEKFVEARTVGFVNVAEKEAAKKIWRAFGERVAKLVEVLAQATG